MLCWIPHARPLYKCLDQVKPWFCYDVIFGGKGEQIQVPNGSLCGDCGVVMESWPGVSAEDIRAKLEDPTFAAVWDFAMRRKRGEIPRTGREQVVDQVVLHGMRAEWPGAFIEEATLIGLGANYIRALDKKKLKITTIEDPDFKQRHGIVVRDEDRVCSIVRLHSLMIGF